MKSSDIHKQIFGEISSLAENIAWTTGVSNMLGWLTWDTKNVLGVSKTAYLKQIADWCNDESIKDCSPEEKLTFVKAMLKKELTANNRLNKYDKSRGIASPREALRRARFFSEDYLNKEFDIFWGLVSDIYLDSYYSQFTSLSTRGQWYTHGNSGLYSCSVGITEMQMDNLSYNPDEKLLIANELKLGGRKNPDQLLKYAYMYKVLAEKGFIAEGSRFLMLFIGDKEEAGEWDTLIDKEIDYCRKSTKSTCKLAVQPECIKVARNTTYASTTWAALKSFNDSYMKELRLPEQQVEHKLIWGFNECLAEKAFIDCAS